MKMSNLQTTKKICSLKHSRHTVLGTCTVWSLLNVNWTILGVGPQTHVSLTP